MLAPATFATTAWRRWTQCLTPTCFEISKLHRSSKGHGPTVLRILGDILAQCCRSRINGAKCLKSVFVEEQRMVALGLKGRRHSGRLTGKQLQAHKLQNFGGLAEAHVGASIFAQPRPFPDPKPYSLHPKPNPSMQT